jgi:N-acetylglucosamine malate deacetylase 1
MNVLAIGAHPDDVDFCCGGTLIRLAQAGHRVVICVVTDGRAPPLGDPEQVAARRRQEAQRSAALAGA